MKEFELVFLSLEFKSPSIAGDVRGSRSTVHASERNYPMLMVLDKDHFLNLCIKC